MTQPTTETLRGQDGQRSGPFLRAFPPAAGCAKGRDGRAVDAGGAVEAHQSKKYISPSGYLQEPANNNHPCAGQRCRPLRPGTSSRGVGATAGALNGRSRLPGRLPISHAALSAHDRNGDYADPHASEESPHIMTRRRGRRAQHPALLGFPGGRTADVSGADGEPHTRLGDATPSRSASPSSSSDGPQRWRTTAAPAPTLSGNHNAFPLASCALRSPRAIGRAPGGIQTQWHRRRSIFQRRQRPAAAGGRARARGGGDCRPA